MLVEGVCSGYCVRDAFEVANVGRRLKFGYVRDMFEVANVGRRGMFAVCSRYIRGHEMSTAEVFNVVPCEGKGADAGNWSQVRKEEA